MADIKMLADKAKEIRCDLLTAIHHAGSGHPGGSLSCVEILVALYFNTMRIKVEDPKWEDRDRFLLGKGHAGPALFATLANKGFFEREYLNTLRKVDSDLQGAPSLKTPGGDMSSGSLGQNLSVAVGMALAGKMNKKDYKVYIVLGDGELAEGQIWEAAMSAAKFNLGNLVAIIDNNHVQMCGTIDEIMPLGNVAEKFSAFGFNVINIDGHNLEEIIETFDKIDRSLNKKPTMIIADTVKGKGVSFMEGKALWHGGSPNKEQLSTALEEIGGAK